MRSDRHSRFQFAEGVDVDDEQTLDLLSRQNLRPEYVEHLRRRRTEKPYGDNTEAAKEGADAPIVNLHPSFVFSKDEIDSPNAFPSIEFGSDMVRAAIAARVLTILE